MSDTAMTPTGTVEAPQGDASPRAKERDEVAISFWDTKAPSQYNVLFLLMKTFDLLSEALPIAMLHAGTQDLRVQQNFWRSFVEFDRATDVASADGHPSLEMAVSMQIEDWRQLVEELAFKAKVPNV